MGLNLFQRRRRSVTPYDPSPLAGKVALRVLVDSGPLARELFVIDVPADGDVGSIREAIVAHIGHASIGLFKVDIPWQAYYEAGAYETRYGVAASLLSAFPGYNLDDASQVGPSGGVCLPAYKMGQGSLRARRSGAAGSGPAPTVRQWFPEDDNTDAINILARTASGSNLDWARPSVKPLTLSARFANSSIPSAFDIDSETDAPTLVDISPDATVAELKVALLIAAGRPAPAGFLDGLILWRVDMDAGALEALDASGCLAGGMPWPLPRGATPPLLLENPDARVSDYFNSYRACRANPSAVTLSAWIHPLAESVLAPRTRTRVPRFTYPMSHELLHPRRAREERLRAAISTQSMRLNTPTPDDHAGTLLRCCDEFAATSSSSGFTGCGSLADTPGLIGLGIMMPSSPASEASDNASDDEGLSWPATPDVSEDTRSLGSHSGRNWLPPSSLGPSPLPVTEWHPTTAKVPNPLSTAFMPPNSLVQ